MSCTHQRKQTALPHKDNESSKKMAQVYLDVSSRCLQHHIAVNTVWPARKQTHMHRQQHTFIQIQDGEVEQERSLVTSLPHWRRCIDLSLSVPVYAYQCELGHRQKHECILLCCVAVRNMSWLNLNPSMLWNDMNPVLTAYFQGLMVVMMPHHISAAAVQGDLTVFIHYNVFAL